MQRLRKLSNYSRDLVHYTSASNALRILRTRRVTLRNASLMNDFSEIDHGEKCLVKAWHSDQGRGTATPHNGRLFNLLGRISPTIVPAIEQSFDRHSVARKANTFILSLAEHNDQAEGLLGKLSMWRAYGGRTNVAIVVNPSFLFNESTSGVYSTPVIYSSLQEFADQHFTMLLNSIEENFNEVAILDRDYIISCVLLAFNSIAMATKHPGFEEEKEWRLIFAPWQDPDNNIRHEVVEISGMPQKVYYEEFSNDEASPLSLNKLLKKIIVGPTESPRVVYEAFVKELEDAGIPDAAKKVVVSDIPIRR